MTLRTALHNISLIFWPQAWTRKPCVSPDNTLSRREFLHAATFGAAVLSVPSISPLLAHDSLPEAIAPASKQDLYKNRIGQLAIDSLAKLQKLPATERRKEIANIEWNNIITFFTLSQEIDLPHVDDIRAYVLENGSTDSSIPIHVLDAAISTVHDWAKNIEGMDTLERKERVYELLKPYIGKYATDDNNSRITAQGFPANKLQTEMLEPSHTNYAVSAVISEEELAKFTLNKDTQDILTLYSEGKMLPEQMTRSVSTSYTTNKIEDLLNLEEETKLFHAKNLLLLAMNKSANALELCTEWFNTKARTQSPFADIVVLRALALLAQTDNNALDILKNIAKDHSNLFFHRGYFSTHELDESGYNTEAGDAITQALNNNPEDSKSFLKSLIEPSNKGNKTGPILALSTLHDSSNTLDTLRSILQNKKYNNEEQVAAMVGLVRAKDKESIPTLLEIACNDELSEKLREKALVAITLIDSQDPIPDSFKKQYATESPCGLDFSIVDDFLSFNQISPHLIRGHAALGISIEETVAGTIRELDYRTTLSNGLLENLSERNESHLEKLTELYLRKNKEGLDLPMAIIAMKILSSSKYKNAIPDIINMSTHSEGFVENTPKDNVYTNLANPNTSKEPAANALLLREVATLFLGKMANPLQASDEGFESLYTIATEGDPLFRKRAYQAINHMAKEFQDSEVSPHLDKVLKILNSFIAEHTIAFNARKTDFRDSFNSLFLLLDSACKLGGEAELLKIGKENKHLTRLISNVLKANDRTDIFKTAYQALPRENNVRIAMIDGGPVMLKDQALQEQTINPKKFASTKKPGSQFAAHANSVRKIIGGEVTAYSYDLTQKHNRDKSTAIQETGYLAMIDIIANNLRENEVPIDILSQSRGVKTRHLEKPETRRLVDLSNSAFTFLNEVGVLCLNTPGNDGGSKHGNYSGELGSYSALGLRMRGRDKYEIPPNLLFVNVASPYGTEKLAPFASQTNPHGKLAIPSTMVDGTSILDWYNGLRIETATSFSLPQFTNQIAAIISERRKKGLPDTSPQEIVQILSRHEFNPQLARQLLLYDRISSK